MDTSTLLAQCARLINRYGPDSRKVQEFIDRHRDNREFLDLSLVARRLKKAVTMVHIRPDRDC